MLAIPKKYFTQLPNVIDDIELSLIAFRLYVHLKRVAGDNGNCYQSSNTLAKACNMSMGAISKAKGELEKAGLIIITEKKDKLKSYHDITITDIWGKNTEKYGGLSRSDDSLSRSEQHPSPSERLTSPGETIKNPIINNTTRREAGGEKTSPPDTKKNLYPIAKVLSDVTGMDITKNRGRLFKEAKDYKPEEVEEILQIYGPGGAWYTDDWRGKKGDRPKLGDIRETWGKYRPAPVSTKKQVVKSTYHDGQWWMEYVDEP